jgi:hypothetical protein
MAKTLDSSEAGSGAAVLIPTTNVCGAPELIQIVAVPVSSVNVLDFPTPTTAIPGLRVDFGVPGSTGNSFNVHLH